MGKSREQQYAEQIYDFIAKVLSNPLAATKNPGELDAVIATYKALERMIPGMMLPMVPQFELFIRQLAANPAFRESVRSQTAPQNTLGTGMPQPPQPPGSASPQDLAKFQKQMQDYMNMMQMLSNSLRNMQDTQKSIIRNIQ